MSGKYRSGMHRYMYRYMHRYMHRHMHRYNISLCSLRYSNDDDDEATIALGDPIMNDGDEIIKKTANYEAQCISPLGIFKC